MRRLPLAIAGNASAMSTTLNHVGQRGGGTSQTKKPTKLSAFTVFTIGRLLGGGSAVPSIGWYWRTADGV